MLNESEFSDDDLADRTIELKIQECFRLYKHALFLQRSGDILGAAKVFKELDETDILQLEIPGDVSAWFYIYM